ESAPVQSPPGSHHRPGAHHRERNRVVSSPQNGGGTAEKESLVAFRASTELSRGRDSGRRPFLGAPSRLSSDRTGGSVISTLEEKDSYDVGGAKSDGHGGAESSCQKHEADIRERLDASAAVLGQLITAPDRPIPKQVLPEARCIVVVPSLASFALGIGVRRGKGVATCRVTKDWSAPAPVAFTGGSVGFQMGGEKIDLIMIGMNQSAIERLLSSKLKVGKNISVMAGPVASEAST